MRCGCGEVVTEGSFSDDLDPSCGGTGMLNCYCGGDICVCHNHGEFECDGCEDCEYGDEAGGWDPVEDEA